MSRGFPTGRANLVTVAQALHWFDLDPFLREARRVLAPGGVLAAWCYSRCTVDYSVDEIVDVFYRVTLGPYWSRERKLVDEGYRTIALPLDEMAPPPFEMIEQWSLSEFAGYIRTWSAVDKFIEARGEEPVLAFESALAEMWGAAEHAATGEVSPTLPHRRDPLNGLVCARGTGHRSCSPTDGLMTPAKASAPRSTPAGTSVQDRLTDAADALFRSAIEACRQHERVARCSGRGCSEDEAEGDGRAV